MLSVADSIPAWLPAVCGGLIEDLLCARRYEDALNILNELQPDDHQIAGLRWRCYAEQGKHREALAAVAAVTRPDSYLLQLTAVSHLAGHEWAEAERSARASLAEAPNAATAKILARAVIRERTDREWPERLCKSVDAILQVADAIGKLNSLPTDNDEEACARDFLKAETYLGAGLFEHAAACYGTIDLTAAGTLLFHVQISRSVLAFRTGEPAIGFDHFVNACVTFFNDPELDFWKLHYVYAFELEHESHLRKACDLIRTHLSIASQAPPPVVLAGLKCFEFAEDQFTNRVQPGKLFEAFEIYPNPKIQDDLAVGCRRTGQIAQSIQHHLAHALWLTERTNGEAPGNYNYSDEIHLTAEAGVDVHRTFMKVLKEHRSEETLCRVFWPFYRSFLRRIHFEAKRHATILETLKILDWKRHGAPADWWDYGYAAHLSGKLEEAEGAYEEVLRRVPDEQAAIHNCILVRRAMGKLGEALRLCRQGLANRPGDENLLRLEQELDGMLLKRTREKDAAEAARKREADRQTAILNTVPLRSLRATSRLYDFDNLHTMVTIGEALAKYRDAATEFEQRLSAVLNESQSAILRLEERKRFYKVVSSHSMRGGVYARVHRETGDILEFMHSFGIGNCGNVLASDYSFPSLPEADTPVASLWLDWYLTFLRIPFAISEELAELAAKHEVEAVTEAIEITGRKLNGVSDDMRRISYIRGILGHKILERIAPEKAAKMKEFYSLRVYWSHQPRGTGYLDQTAVLQWLEWCTVDEIRAIMNVANGLWAELKSEMERIVTARAKQSLESDSLTEVGQRSPT